MSDNRSLLIIGWRDGQKGRHIVLFCSVLMLLDELSLEHGTAGGYRVFEVGSRSEVGVLESLEPLESLTSPESLESLSL